MIIDSHCHLTDAKYQQPSAVVADMLASNVNKCISCGDNFESSKLAYVMAQQNPCVYCSIGVHPHEANTYSAQFEKFLEENYNNKKVVAVGEIGLDYYYNLSPQDVQREVLTKQIKLAYKYQLPLIFHCREATQDFLNILQQNKQYLKYGGVVHSFSGSLETANILLDMGLYLSFNGIITFKNANKILDVIKSLPKDRVLIETDSPYLTPEPFRGQLNQPKNVKLVLSKLSCLWEMREIDVEKIVEANTFKLFKKLGN